MKQKAYSGQFRNWQQILAYLLILTSAEHACLMPKDAYDRYKESKCVFLDTRTKEIKKICNDGDFGLISSLEVEAKYDTVKIINSKPRYSYTLFESVNELVFPCNLDSIIKDKNKTISISLKTDSRDCSYYLTIDKKDWAKDSLWFTYYYHRN